VILAIHTLRFLMEVQEGHKGQREAYFLFCSPRELREEQEDEDEGIG
jgi:hypothetical protein